MFIDQAKIFVRSGKGGDGVVHFRREKYVPRGGPDGGDGGKGGDVILKVVPTLNTLSTFRHKNKFYAQNGMNGAKQNMTGKSGEDLIIPVPPGTIVYDEEQGTVLGDLVEDGQELIVARGGRGGHGNTRFKSSTNRVPRIAEKGEPPEERVLRLELKLIADVGIIGVPNAGKSTFLSVVTNAKPKIASYPFTTLEPNLGVAVLDDETSLVLADIPGLIEGAHQGVGLGHDFLRHIQRTKVLIHLLDGLAEDPVLDYIQINSELALFDPKLAEKPQVVALNKADLPQVKDRINEVKSGLAKLGQSVDEQDFFVISAIAGTNVRRLLYRVAQKLSQIPPESSQLEMPVYRLESEPRAYEITHREDGWHISGEAIERAAAMTYWEYYQSVRRFQRILETLGIDEELREAGVMPGDSVFIGEHELEWEE
jgi:GTP-binding protein